MNDLNQLCVAYWYFNPGNPKLKRLILKENSTNVGVSDSHENIYKGIYYTCGN